MSSSSGPEIVVVGGGASGMMAAGTAAEHGARVLLLEKTKRQGKKLLLTGNGRCNLTNAKALDDFISMYGPNGRFLYGAFRKYFREDLLAFLRARGLETTEEEDGRVFPLSGDAGEVVRLFCDYLDSTRVHVKTGVRVGRIMTQAGRVIGVQTDTDSVPATAVVLATGGASYPATGSSGDGYRIAAEVGHAIVRIRPALVPLEVVESALARSLQGISVPGVRLSAFQCKAGDIVPLMWPKADSGRGIPGKRPRPPVIESRVGDIMFTHFGIGGPVTLQMSLAVVDALEFGPVSVSVDFRPDLSGEELDRELQVELERSGKRSCRNVLKDHLPERLSDTVMDRTGMPRDKPGHQVSSHEREKLVEAVKSFAFNIERPLPLAKAMVTAGGVSLDEIDPRTMSSRLVRGLYFCGEVMDIDADTGGYNLQAAFSTGFVAGQSAAAYAATRRG